MTPRDEYTALLLRDRTTLTPRERDRLRDLRWQFGDTDPAPDTIPSPDFGSSEEGGP